MDALTQERYPEWRGWVPTVDFEAIQADWERIEERRRVLIAEARVEEVVWAKRLERAKAHRDRSVGRVRT